MDQLTLTAKIQIIVPDDTVDLLDNTMHTYRDACNHVSDHIFQTRDLVQRTLNEALYYDLKQRFTLRSQMAQSVIKTVVAKYKTILENQGEWIKPVFKKPQYDLVWNRDYSLKDGYFSVNTLNGRVKLAYVEKGMEKYFDHSVYSFGTAKLVKKHGKYFLHIPVMFDIPGEDLSSVCNVVGVDRGINFIAATYRSDGSSRFYSGRQVKQKRAGYVRLRKELQMRKTPSARRRLKAVGSRENRWMQDVNHQVSKALVEGNPANMLFVLEDLEGIRSVTERVRRKYRYVSVSWSFYDLEQKITYKARRRGSSVIKVDPHYTSQCCPKCGHTEAANRNKKTHTFCCKNCGYRSNDDRIGAMNLYRMGISYLMDNGVPRTVMAG